MSGNTSATGGYLVPEIAPLEGDGLHDVLQGAISGISGIPGRFIRPRWQPNPPTQPAKTQNWAAFGIERITKYDYPVIIHDGAGDGASGRDILRRQELLAVLISFFGPNAWNKAQQMRDGLYIPQNLEALAAQDIKLYEAGDPIALPALVNSDFIMRVDLEVTFIRVVQTAYAIRNILSSDFIISSDVEISTGGSLTVEASVGPPFLDENGNILTDESNNPLFPK